MVQGVHSSCKAGVTKVQQSTCVCKEKVRDGSGFSFSPDVPTKWKFTVENTQNKILANLFLIQCHKNAVVLTIALIDLCRKQQN